MDSPLLQRIVGAAVLVALGVIFIPALLDGSGYKSRQLHDVEMHEKPEFPPLRKNQVPAIKSPLQTTEKTAGSSYNSKKTSNAGDKSTAVKAAVKNKRPVRAFALQVGTFENNRNAEKLREKLKRAGYPSFVVPVVEKDKKSYKVRVGPELEKKQLMKTRDKIKKAYKLDGYIVNHP